MLTVPGGTQHSALPITDTPDRYYFFHVPDNQLHFEGVFTVQRVSVSSYAKGSVPIPTYLWEQAVELSFRPQFVQMVSEGGVEVVYSKWTCSQATWGWLCDLNNQWHLFGP